MFRNGYNRSIFMTYIWESVTLCVHSVTYIETNSKSRSKNLSERVRQFHVNFST